MSYEGSAHLAASITYLLFVLEQCFIAALIPEKNLNSNILKITLRELRIYILPILKYYSTNLQNINEKF